MGLIVFLMRADQPLSPEFVPFLYGVIIIGGIFAVPVIWGIMLKMDFFSSLPGSLILCILLLLAFQRDFRIVWIRGIISLVLISVIAVYLSITSRMPMFTVGVFVAVILMIIGGYIGIWTDRLLGKITGERRAES